VNEYYKPITKDSQHNPCSGLLIWDGPFLARLYGPSSAVCTGHKWSA